MTATATNVIDTLTERGFVAQISDEPGLRRALDSGQVTLYQGFDPTATSLHTGNLVGIMALAHFQRAGHRPIAVVGGGTGMIGDPSGRSAERPLLTLEQIDRNLAGIRVQFERFLDFGDGRAMLVNNADWLRSLNYINFVRDVGRHFTVNQLMQHGTYWERFQEGSFSFIELNYALVQAYDFLHLFREANCILQIGGNDQWFNILAGRDLIRRSVGGEAFALTTPLVTSSSGAKLGKTAGNAVWLDPAQTSPFEYFQYWRNTEDSDVSRYLRLFTFLAVEEIEQIVSGDINAAKERLAVEATAIAHGRAEAESALQTARARFRGEGTDAGPSFATDTPISVEQLAVRTQLVKSIGEAKRLIAQDGIRLNGQPAARDQQIHGTDLPLLLSVGKRSVRVVES